MSKRIRVGIFGVSRGSCFFDSILANNGDIVAICDKHERRAKEAVKRLGKVAVYDNFDEFIKHPMDAVLLANYFHEHTEYAIRCLEKGIHVLSECTAAATLADAVKLVRAAEKSNAIYMLAENYPYMTFNREMKRICDEGTLGKLIYAEGEYNHAGDPYGDAGDKANLYDGEKHWRLFLPRTYYVTHSLAPIMFATGANPVRVTAMPVFAPVPRDANVASNSGDKAAIITTLNDDDSVFKFVANSSFGACDNSYRICGEYGQVENVRGTGGKIMLRYNKWNKPADKECINYYMPGINDKDEELIKTAGHGGGDFFVIRHFLECVRENKPHPFDVYFATRLSAVAIMAYRSMMERGVPYDIPDFRKEEDRIKYENDTDSPFWYSDGTAPTVPCCSHPDYAPSEVQKENFMRLLAESEASKARELEK